LPPNLIGTTQRKAISVRQGPARYYSDLMLLLLSFASFG
jgi:hypothetical protein